MRSNPRIEALINELHGFDRGRCMSELHQVDRVRLDFTDEFLDSLSVDRLRHILLAALLQSGKSGTRPPSSS